MGQHNREERCCTVEDSRQGTVNVLLSPAKEYKGQGIDKKAHDREMPPYLAQPG